MGLTNCCHWFATFAHAHFTCTRAPSVHVPGLPHSRCAHIHLPHMCPDFCTWAFLMHVHAPASKTWLKRTALCPGRWTGTPGCCYRFTWTGPNHLNITSDMIPAQREEEKHLGHLSILLVFPSSSPVEEEQRQGQHAVWQKSGWEGSPLKMWQVSSRLAQRSWGLLNRHCW